MAMKFNTGDLINYSKTRLDDYFVIEVISVKISYDSEVVTGRVIAQNGYSDQAIDTIVNTCATEYELVNDNRWDHLRTIKPIFVIDTFLEALNGLEQKYGKV